jgi:hypothetical protein
MGELAAKDDEGAFFGDLGYDWCIGEMLKVSSALTVFVWLLR